MTITRRQAILGTGAVVLLAACGPEPTLTVSAQGSAGMNLGPDGQDRPLTLTVVQMSGTGAFDGADFFALQNPQAALGGDFVGAEQIVLAPGGSASKTIGIKAGATTIGIVAGFRDPAGMVFRLKTAAPSGAAGVIIAVSAGGITLQSA